MTNICINSACKMSATCSHALEYNKVAKELKLITVINPKTQIMDEEGKCQLYHTPQKIIYAYGFLKEMEKMTHNEYLLFTKRMTGVFNRTYFYKMRNGSMPISPEDQQKIIAVASSIGYTFPTDAWDRIEETIE